MVLTRQQKIKYYKNRHLVEQIVRDYARRKQLILFGGKAINLNVKKFLNTYSADFDFLHENPKKIILALEKKLDRYFEGNYFKVMKGKHEGTYKLKSNVTKRTIADITKQKEEIETRNIKGLKVATAKHLRKRIRKTLKNPANAYRFDRERENLQRLNLSENNNHQKQSNNLQDFVYKGFVNARSKLPMNSNKGKKEQISLW